MWVTVLLLVRGRSSWRTVSALSQVDLQTQLSKLTVSWNHYPRDRRQPSSGWFQAIQHQLTEQKEKIDSWSYKDGGGESLLPLGLRQHQNKKVETVRVTTRGRYHQIVTVWGEVWIQTFSFVVLITFFQEPSIRAETRDKSYLQREESGQWQSNRIEFKSWS